MRCGMQKGQSHYLRFRVPEVWRRRAVAVAARCAVGLDGYGCSSEWVRCQGSVLICWHFHRTQPYQNLRHRRRRNYIITKSAARQVAHWHIGFRGLFCLNIILLQYEYSIVEIWINNYSFWVMKIFWNITMGWVSLTCKLCIISQLVRRIWFIRLTATCGHCFCGFVYSCVIRVLPWCKLLWHTMMLSNSRSQFTCVEVNYASYFIIIALFYIHVEWICFGEYWAHLHLARWEMVNISDVGDMSLGSQSTLVTLC